MNLSTTFASMRKTVAGIGLVTLIAGMFATGVATAATSHVFSDVPADAWFAQYVNGLADSGVVDSTMDMYRPSDLVNRAEMAKFAFQVSGLPLEHATAAPFKDVPMGQWYTDYVYTLSKNGIVSGDKLNGVPTGWFRPSDALNRAEASKMLVNAAQMAEDLSGAPHFPDVMSTDWFYNFVETLFNNGVIAGYPDGTFGPAKNINRAEVAKMVYLSMNPVSAGFTLDSASAASLTSVELIYSMNVDQATAETVANYKVLDSSGNPLTVSAAHMTAPDTVLLTTTTQTQGKVYYVTPMNIKSAAGDDLANTDSVSFLGFGADVTGGDLKVSLSTETPVAGSVPSGATGVVFTCWDFTGGASASVVQSLHVHRVGPGSQDAFSNVYLYNGDQRLTTGRSINSETQTVEFNNINVPVAAGQNVKLCLVGDLTTTSNGGVHAFELVSADDVMSNSSNMTGSFPLRGADQLITSAVVGTTTISKNGSLDELTVGQTGARIAQFQIEADGSEDQMLNRIALYIRGSVTVSDIKNMQLFVEGQDTALASTDMVGFKDLATFKLATPYKIGRGQKKIFYVTADLSTGRDKDNIKTYLDESTDLNVTGVTYGYGTRVTDTAYDGTETTACPSAGCQASFVTIKGSAFNVAFTGPSASDVATGQTAVRCLDLTITNGSGSDVELKDWVVNLDLSNTPALNGDGGLYNTTAGNNNYTLIKLAQLNDDGTIGGSILGPSELPDTTHTAAFDKDSGDVKLSGTYSLAANQSIKTSVVFNTANNTAMAGDKIVCSLKDLTAVPDSVRDVNGDALGASSITPAATIVGNTMTLTQSALKISVSASPSSKTVVKGTNNVDLLGLTLSSGSSLDNTLKNIALQGYVDNAGPDTTFGAGTDNDSALQLKDVVSNLGLFDGNTQVGTFANVSSSTGKITFNNLTVSIPKNTSKNLTLRGNLSNSTANGVRIKFAVVDPADVISIDQNGQTVSGIDVSNALNGTTTDTGVRITINSSGSVTVSQSGSADGAALGGTITGVQLANIKFNVSNADSTLDDFDLGILGEPSTLVHAYAYDATCTTQLAMDSGIVNGAVQFSGASITLPVGNTTLCFKGDLAQVKDNGTDQPVSGSYTGLYLRDITKLTSGGSEISNSGAVAINSEPIGAGQTLSVAQVPADTALCTATNPALVAGNVLYVNKELEIATAASIASVPCGGFVTPVVKGVAGTSAVAQALGTEVRIVSTSIASNIVPAGSTTGVVKGDVVITLNAGVLHYYVAKINTPLVAADAVEIPTAAPATPFAAANAFSRFVLHGNASILRKAVPALSNDATPAGGSTLASASQFITMGADIAASGQGQVELLPANGNTLTFAVTGSGFPVAAVAGNYCAVYNAGGTKLASANSAASMTFTMGTTASQDNSGVTASATGVTIPVGTSTRLELRCATASASGASLSATWTGMTYGDGTTSQPNNNDTGLLTQKFPINGPTFTQP